MLEDLCLSTVRQEPVMTCVAVKKYLEVETYLALQEKPVPAIALGTRKGYWNFDDPALDELKEFLSALK